jgi:hypothetical protein
MVTSPSGLLMHDFTVLCRRRLPVGGPELAVLLDGAQEYGVFAFDSMRAPAQHRPHHDVAVDTELIDLRMNGSRQEAARQRQLEIDLPEPIEFLIQDGAIARAEALPAGPPANDVLSALTHIVKEI